MDKQITKLWAFEKSNLHKLQIKIYLKYKQYNFFKCYQLKPIDNIFHKLCINSASILNTKTVAV